MVNSPGCEVRRWEESLSLIQMASELAIEVDPGWVECLVGSSRWWSVELESHAHAPFIWLNTPLSVLPKYESPTKPWFLRGVYCNHQGGEIVLRKTTWWVCVYGVGSKPFIPHFEEWTSIWNTTCCRVHQGTRVLANIHLYTFIYNVHYIHISSYVRICMFSCIYLYIIYIYIIYTRMLLSWLQVVTHLNHAHDTSPFVFFPGHGQYFMDFRGLQGASKWHQIEGIPYFQTKKTCIWVMGIWCHERSPERLFRFWKPAGQNLLYPCMYVCMYIYIFVYIFIISLYIYVYTHTHTVLMIIHVRFFRQLFSHLHH